MLLFDLLTTLNQQQTLVINYLLVRINIKEKKVGSINLKSFILNK